MGGGSSILASDETHSVPHLFTTSYISGKGETILISNTPANTLCNRICGSNSSSALRIRRFLFLNNDLITGVTKYGYYALLTGIDILIRFKSIVGLYIVSSSFIYGPSCLMSATC